MAYLLGTNILIEAKNKMPFDLFPSFWTRLGEQIAAGKVFSSVKVREEIERGNDDDPLIQWLDDLPETFFPPLDGNILAEYAVLINWANSNTRYKPAAKAQFASADVADAFLVATSAAKDLILVTHEVPEPKSQKSVKIPDAANVLSVKCCTLVEMLRSLGVTI